MTISKLISYSTVMSQSCQDTDCSVEFLPTLGVNLYLLSSPNQHILALVILSAKTKAKMC
jgi:hypothetical protein